MDPDGFEFDSSANYLGDPDEFPWCETGHLIISPGEIESDVRSLSAAEKRMTERMEG